MRLNQGGLILCAAYIVLSSPLLALAIFTADYKGKYILLQLALAPVGILTTGLGLVDAIMARPWLNNYYVMFALNLALTYFVGWMVSLVGSFMERLERGSPGAP